MIVVVDTYRYVLKKGISGIRTRLGGTVCDIVTHMTVFLRHTSI